MPTPHEYVAKDGRKTWRVRFRLGGRNCSETFDTKPEATKFCRSTEAHGSRVALRLLDDNRARGRVTLDELAEEFFTWKAARVRSDRTVTDYRRDYRRSISPVLGARPAASIDEADVQTLIDTLSRTLAPKTVADRHSVLHGIYAWAIAPKRRDKTGIDYNPCTSTDLPKRRRPQPKGLRPAEWQALYAALQQINPDAADLAFFLVSTGWRISEAMALSAFDVEDDGHTVHVTVGQVVRRNAAGQHVIVEDAKSEAGIRRIKLDEQCAAMVRRRADSAHGGLVFTTTTGRQWHYANFLNRTWKPAVEAARLTRKPTPHWLRHSHVFWMAVDGKTSMAELQRRIGHEHYSTTVDVYGRMIDDVSPAALEGFAAMRDQALTPATVAVAELPAGAAAD